MQFSVIIPTLNEQSRIGDCITRIRRLEPAAQVIVADGGSSDDTLLMAEKAGATVCNSTRGRGRQLNAGARLASGNILVFLHADTHLPHNAFSLMREYFAHPDVRIAKFRLGFDKRNWFLDTCAWFTRYDSVLTSFGDQCIVVRRSFYASLGGFPDWPLFEDVRFLQEARKKARIHSLPARVTTSYRRFDDRGAIRQMVMNAWHVARYLLGADPEELARAYGGNRRESGPVAVIVFARYPVPGKVKTRLAKDLGEGPATEFYAAWARHALDQVRKLDGDVTRYVFYAGGRRGRQVRDWAGDGFHLVAQNGENLGERMLNAFRTVFENGARKAIILATDAPDLSASLVEGAIQALDSRDAVVGPCHDGGYYLLGIKELHTDLFLRVPWSTQWVLSTTIARLKNLGLSYMLLPALYDIDTVDDLRCWCLSQTDGTEVTANVACARDSACRVIRLSGTREGG